jgi:hypothetical protein
MKSLINTATGALLAVTFVFMPMRAQAQDTVGRGSIFVPEAPSPEVVPAEEDLEIVTDIDFFTGLGYSIPDFNVYYNLRHEVASEIVIPDYTKRTGQVPPEDTRLEVASVYLTGGDFNDIVVYSFMPGDCGRGCLAQIYRTPDGIKWEKVLEFKSLGFAYKQAEGDKPTEVVAVGGTTMNNRIFTWDGHAFVEK